MRVRVEFIAPSGPVNGRKDVEVELEEGGTIKDLVRVICHKYGEKGRKMLVQPDGKTPYVNFIVNKTIVPLDYVVKKNDDVTVLPPVVAG